MSTAKRPPCEMGLRPDNQRRCGKPSAWEWTPTPAHKRKGHKTIYFCEGHHVANRSGKGNPYWTVAALPKNEARR